MKNPHGPANMLQVIVPFTKQHDSISTGIKVGLFLKTPTLFLLTIF